jgi:hypothetical protein
LEVKDQNKEAASDFDNIIQQLNSLADYGHYIYPHIHPHWADARYLSEINQWELENLRYYRAESISTNSLEKLFQNSISLLKKYVPKTADPKYRWAYRAGGWCIQPFNIFSKIFTFYGIDADFSVLAGHSVSNQAIKIDFSSLPKNQKPYTFSKEVNHPSIGNFYQYPISSIPLLHETFFARITNSILWRLGFSKGLGDGIGASFGVTEKKYFQNEPIEMVSIELITRKKVNHYLSFAGEEGYIQFISHPKMISELHLLHFNKFLRKLNNSYSIESDWIKMGQYFS